MTIEEKFDERIIACLDSYSEPKGPIGTNLHKSILHAKGADMIVPVLGMQGVGKSTLINALLGEDILPVEVDETTCVPVEVKYGEEECALIHFYDNERVVRVNSKKELTLYVDNNYNRANEKHVANIELYRKKAILRNGLVIVDLPGVGSLTKENEKTTRRYVENLCSAIFVIPIDPPIRGMEVLFIKSLWSQFSKAIFVQNYWGETKEQLAEGVEYNSMVLKKIASELNHPYDGENLIVNAKKGIKGASIKDHAMMDSSNIKKLTEKIDNLTENWEKDKERIIYDRILLSIEYAKTVVIKRIEDLKKTHEDVENENRIHYEQFCKGSNELSAKIDSVRRYLRDAEDDFYFMNKKDARECTSRIRAAMFKVVDGGVYDGPRLSEAFKRLQEEEIREYYDKILNELTEIKLKIEEFFDEIDRFEIENDYGFRYESFDTKSSFKWEKGAAWAFNLGGAAVGTIGGGAILAACGVAGPPGWVIASVGVAVYAVFSAVGYGIKKAKQSDRAREAKKQLEPHLDEIEERLIKEIPAKFIEFSSKCQGALDEIWAERKRQEQTLKEQMGRVIDDSQEQFLKDDLAYLEQKMKEFEYE
jgi:GTPase SAR1 family protein